MVILLVVAGWLASLALFVGLRANAAKARLESGDSVRLSAHGITAGSTYARDARSGHARNSRTTYARNTVQLGS
ncbi:MAG TPA: hypothetical protein VN817_00675 [Solirubrobacteraceae bacterium]|nr:hypothetical protein [Solirubrobacteraceae bacterium]